MDTSTVQSPHWASRTLNQILSNWIQPEIDRRCRAGSQPGLDAVMMAQILFPVTDPNVVRLNDEVLGVATVRAVRAIEAGEQVLLSDLREMEAFDLIPEELNNGHITIIRNPPGWFISFNALCGRAACLEQINHAEEFLDVARFAFESGRMHAAIDTLFSCCEILGRARLSLRRSPAGQEEGANHKAIHSALNLERKWGAVDPHFTKLYNWLSEHRSVARYRTQKGKALAMIGRHLALDPESIEIVDRERDAIRLVAAPRVSSTAD